MKTKPLQHSVNELRRIGIQPDIILARSSKMIDHEARRKIALFGTIPENAVFCSYNVKSVYEVPLILDEQGMGAFIQNRLKVNAEKTDFARWRQFVSALTKPKHRIKVNLVGKYAGLADSYVSMSEAFKHAGAALYTEVELNYAGAERFERKPKALKELDRFDGIFVPYGFGSRGAEGKVRVIQFARENDIPFLGICYGFQLAVIEFARNICGLEKANTAENDPASPQLVIDFMPEQKIISMMGATMRLGAHKIIITRDSLAHSLYGAEEIYERHRHRYEVNPEYRHVLEKSGLVFSGRSVDGKRMEILELPKQSFFFASQFHGEFQSRPGKPDPEYYGFVQACLEKKLSQRRTPSV